MKIRGRVLVLAVSVPVIAFAVIGGFLGKSALAREDSYQDLRIFEDVVSLINSNYVEEVNIDKVMHGAMHGLADGLDPDSAYLDVAQVKVLDKGDAGDGAIAMTTAVLTDNGTSGAAEVFAAALSGNKRATLVGERTFGRAARQKLVRLPDGSALMLTHLIYMTPASVAIHEKGLVPDVPVEQPDVEFGQARPAKDSMLDKAIESLAVKAAA